MATEIDCTPTGLQTAEGRAKTALATTEFEKARERMEMEAMSFLKQHCETLVYALTELGDEGAAALEDLNDLRGVMADRNAAAETFVRALAGIA